jgi:hypothetical protein
VAVLIALAILTGALVATYAIARDAAPATKRAGIGSGVLGWFAVSCPACNVERRSNDSARVSCPGRRGPRR